MIAPGVRLPDLNALLEKAYSLDAGRGDDHLAHVSDLAGCDKATWARRNGLAPADHDTNTRVKFDLGLTTEKILIDRVRPLLEAEGWEVVLGQGLALSVAGSIDVQPYLQGIVFPPGYLDSPNVFKPSPEEKNKYLFGHPDYVLRKDGQTLVIDAKSETFYPTFDKLAGKRTRIPPPTPRWHYLVQCSAYAFANGADRFGIWSVCRESGMRNRTDVATFWFNTKDFEALLTRRVGEVLERTAPGSPEPACDPEFCTDEHDTSSIPPGYAWNQKKKSNWRCSYCSYLGCELNTKGDDNAD